VQSSLDSSLSETGEDFGGRFVLAAVDLLIEMFELSNGIAKPEFAFDPKRVPKRESRKVDR
jgi:hypothetical protein